MGTLYNEHPVLATTEAPKVNGLQCFDAETLREMTQKSLEHIDTWCKENGLSVSALKTHSVMFTWRRNWRDQLSRPLQIDGTEIEIRNTTKFLGVTLDSKLSWNEHIEQKCKKAKGILLQCRRAIGPCWGFNPKTMKWIYTALVRPTLTYAAMTWIYRGVATSMIARHKKPRHDLIIVLQLKSCGAAEKSAA